MNTPSRTPSGALSLWARRAWLMLVACVMVGCSLVPSQPGRERLVGSSPAALEAYYQALSRMSVVDLSRERAVLAALPATPDMQLRLAMLLGNPRISVPDIPKALGLLDNIAKSGDAVAVALRPLVRLLADNYQERQKQEMQLERQGALLKESQRKTVELQDKLDGLADIERTLPARPHAGRAARTGAPR